MQLFYLTCYTTHRGLLVRIQMTQDTAIIRAKTSTRILFNLLLTRKRTLCSTSTSTFDLVGKNLQISHQPLKTKMNVKNVKKKKKKKKP